MSDKYEATKENSKELKESVTDATYVAGRDIVIENTLLGGDLQVTQYRQVQEQIDDLMPELQFSLLQYLLEKFAPAKQQSHYDTLAVATGLLNTVDSPPNDEEVEEMIAEYLVEKYA